MKNLRLWNVAKRAVLGLGLSIVLIAPSPGWARAIAVKNGAFQICQLIDGGTVTTTADGNSKCCATEKGGTHAGRSYCVTCDAHDKNHCALEYERTRRTDTHQTWFNALVARLQWQRPRQ